MSGSEGSKRADRPFMLAKVRRRDVPNTSTHGKRKGSVNQRSATLVYEGGLGQSFISIATDLRAVRGRGPCSKSSRRVESEITIVLLEASGRGFSGRGVYCHEMTS